MLSVRAVAADFEPAGQVAVYSLQNDIAGEPFRWCGSDGRDCHRSFSSAARRDTFDEAPLGICVTLVGELFGR